MSNIQTYSFSRPGFGSLDLELDNPIKQVYKTTYDQSGPYKIEGIGNYSSCPIENIRFFEWQKIQYTYIIEIKNEFSSPFELRINNRIEKKSKEHKSGVHLLSGQFSFNDEVGQTRIEIRDANNRLIFGSRY